MSTYQTVLASIGGVIILLAGWKIVRGGIPLRGDDFDQADNGSGLNAHDSIF